MRTVLVVWQSLMLVIRPEKEQQGSPINTHDSFREVASLGVATPESLGVWGETAVCYVELPVPHAMWGGGPLPSRQ